MSAVQKQVLFVGQVRKLKGGYYHCLIVSVDRDENQCFCLWQNGLRLQLQSYEFIASNTEPLW